MSGPGAESALPGDVGLNDDGVNGKVLTICHVREKWRLEEMGAEIKTVSLERPTVNAAM